LIDKSKNVVIIIPAYNEASAIEGVILGIQKVLGSWSVDILVIDDGSKDHTGELSIASGATTITHIMNSGSGAATATGLEYARRNGYAFAATIDADGQHRSEDLLAVLLRLDAPDKPDLVIGSRLINSAGMSLLKRSGNRGLSLITYMLFGVGGN
jgi:glycosyltransferase involved in cell wall biosynthesis